MRYYELGGNFFETKSCSFRPRILGNGVGTSISRKWTRSKTLGNHAAQIDEINTYHTNRHYLPDLKIPESIKGEKNLKDAVKDADAVLFVVPTKAIRSVAQNLLKW